MLSLIWSALAAILAASASEKYRLIAIIVAIEFALHALAYRCFFLDFRVENKWFIYFIYSAIQLPIMFWLKKVNAHFLIVFLIFINMCYNMFTMAGYFNQNFVVFYYAKDYVVGTIMIFELIYLGMLNKYVAYNRTKHGTSGFIDVDAIFRIGYRYINRGMA